MVDAQSIESELSNLDLPVEMRNRLRNIATGYLSATGGVDPAFLFEFGSLALLDRWNTQRQLDHVDGLPAVVDAAQELIDRAESLGLVEDGALSLFLRLFEVYLDQFAWGARDLVGCDIVLGDLNEGAVVDALAEFLWANRHQVRPASRKLSSDKVPNVRPSIVPDYEMIARLKRNEEN